MYLEAEVSKERPLPGVYLLEQVLALPFGEDRNDKSFLAFEIPNDVRLRVAAPPRNAVPKITHWTLEAETFLDLQ